MNPPSDDRRRRRLLLALASFAAIGAVYAIYWVGFARFAVSTDNAYVNGNIVQITPQTAGTVIAIAADDTDRVEAGQILVELDPTDARVALDQAEAALARTVRELRGTLATTASLQAQVASREAQLARVRSDYDRRLGLRASGAVSREDLAHSEAELRSAQAQLESARQQLAANLAQTEATTVNDNPAVRAAAAVVREAYVGLERTRIPAPVAGYVAKRSVQLGARVQPGAPLMAVVPLQGVWVEANYKEGQLLDVRIGQPVSLKSDLYGGAVRYHGRVEGLAAGTGSAFSLLPAQNATGNWIKVVQRVPVRIALDPGELAEHPLRVGLSMVADVDVHDRSGAQLATARRSEPIYKTEVFDAFARAADERVSAIIAANLGVSDTARAASP